MMESGNKPLVVIDARMVTPIPHGISQYVMQLAKGLEIQKSDGDLSYEPLFLVDPKFKNTPFGSFQIYPVQAPFLNFKEIFEIPIVLNDLKATIYHSPSFSSLWSCPCPSIITIHDLNHLKYGSFSKKLYYEILLRHFALKSKIILTVSEFSRREISSWLNVSPNEIAIVTNALSSSHLDPFDAPSSDLILKKFNLQQGKYFFCLSNFKPHKNLLLLIRAYEKFQNQSAQPWPLVLTVNETISVSGVQAVGGLPELETRVLLKNAGGMVFPSIYEGFGLPPVEAAALGIRLAISQIPPHREGLMDLLPNEVLWVEPHDLEGWAQAFDKIQAGLILPPSPASQNKILERFSAKRMGQRMDLVYQRMLKLAKED